MTILNNLIVPENLKEGTFWDFQTSNMFQSIENFEGGPIGTIKKFRKERLIVPKKIKVKNTQIAKVGIISCFQGSGHRFYNFG